LNDHKKALRLDPGLRRDDDFIVLLLYLGAYGNAPSGAI